MGALDFNLDSESVTSGRMMTEDHSVLSPMSRPRLGSECSMSSQGRRSRKERNLDRYLSQERLNEDTRS